MDRYRERIRENIGYPLLVQERPYDREEIDGYVELMAEICASRRAYTLAALYNAPSPSASITPRRSATTWPS